MSFHHDIYFGLPCFAKNSCFISIFLTLYAPTPEIGQTHSNNLSAVADELFECVWTFCGVGA